MLGFLALMVCDVCWCSPCTGLRGGVHEVVGTYPLCAGFYWVKEYTRGFIPCARWRGLPVCCLRAVSTGGGTVHPEGLRNL